MNDINVYNRLITIHTFTMNSVVISYTHKYDANHNPINLVNNQIATQKKILRAQEMELNNAMLVLSITERNCVITRNRIEFLSKKRDEMTSSQPDDDYVDDFEYENQPDDGDMYDDYEFFPKERKTRKDVLTVIESIKAQKSSKHFKMKPRTVKKDKTKTRESKNRAKIIKESHRAEEF